MCLVQSSTNSPQRSLLSVTDVVCDLLPLLHFMDRYLYTTLQSIHLSCRTKQQKLVRFNSHITLVEVRSSDNFKEPRPTALQDVFNVTFRNSLLLVWEARRQRVPHSSSSSSRSPSALCPQMNEWYFYLRRIAA